MTNIPIGFKDWHKKTLFMPNGESIVCFFFRPKFASMVNVYDINHNIFRLNAQNEVIWQICRDDSNRPPNWWDILDYYARQEGQDAARYPFWDFVLEYPDGSNNNLPQTGTPPDEAIWTPGCTIWLRGSADQQYTLDPETGIAKNVTVGGQRAW
jgi:hypothetical protein